MKKGMMRFVFVGSWFLFYSCSMISPGDSLIGKIAVSNQKEHEWAIYENHTIPKFILKLKYDEEFKYSGLTWLNVEDAFISTESIPGLTAMDYKCDIIKLDVSGKFVDRIYESVKGELAWPLFSSGDDKYLLFTTYWKVDSNKHPFEGLTPMVSLKIMDISQKEVIRSIDSIGRIPNFLVEESPWLHTGYQFVYSIDGETKLKLEGEEKIINPVEATEGVYIFNVSIGDRKLLVPGGRSAIASPTSNQIAYEKDNSIRVLNMSTNEEKIIYKYSSKERLRGKHWTPDGKYIYFAYTYQWRVGDLFHSGEKLIEVSTGIEKPFKKIGHGFDSFTWK